MTALYLKAMGRRHKDICEELNISGLCLRNYLDKYMEEGLEGIKHRVPPAGVRALGFVLSYCEAVRKNG
jgi:hypothetical protein